MKVEEPLRVVGTSTAPCLKFQSMLYVKAVSACAGAIFTSVLVTPLDIVKVRMQAVAQPSRAYFALRPSWICTCAHNLTPINCNQPLHYNYSTITVRAGLKRHGSCLCRRRRSPMIPKSSTLWKNTSSSACSVIRSVVRTGGLLALWGGLLPTLLKAVPNTIVYMILYDELAHSVLPDYGFGKYSPAAAGGLARMAASFFVAPLELVRTQMQADSEVASRGLISKISQIVREQGAKALWRGLEPTLWRDVPFSAIYWLGYEEIMMMIQGSGVFQNKFSDCDGGMHKAISIQSQVFTCFISGASAGAFAALITTPFDYVKTRRQTCVYRGDSKPPNMVSIIRNIIRKEGVPALFTGVTPRVAKVAPACAIMIGAYEIGKFLLG